MRDYGILRLQVGTRSEGSQCDDALFDAVRERVIMTAERGKAGLSCKRMIVMAGQSAVEEEEEGTGLDHPRATQEQKEPMQAGATNLAGATQPLGKRAIFLGHNRSYLSNPPVTFLASIQLRSKTV
jgi:hypothetical protein